MKRFAKTAVAALAVGISTSSVDTVNESRKIEIPSNAVVLGNPTGISLDDLRIDLDGKISGEIGSTEARQKFAGCNSDCIVGTNRKCSDC